MKRFFGLCHNHADSFLAISARFGHGIRARREVVMETNVVPSNKWERFAVPLRRSIQPANFMRVFLRLLLFTAAISGCTGTVPPVKIIDHEHKESTSDPTPTVIIRAVRDSVNGKTYSAKVSRMQTQQRYCSQYDVERDPYAKNNPELARCPHVGYFPDAVTVMVNEDRPCPALNEPDSFWSVQQIGDGTWKVSLYGKAWRVNKIPGGDALQVTASQSCA